MDIRMNAELERADVFSSDRDSLVGKSGKQFRIEISEITDTSPSPEDISILESGILTISENEIRAEADLWPAERASLRRSKKGFRVEIREYNLSFN